MRGIDKLRRAFLRWDHLLVVLVLGLPFLLLIMLGLVWLIQQGAILWFLAVSLVISAVVLILRHILRKRWRQDARSGMDTADLSVSPDPDWLPIEKTVFADVTGHIATLTQSATPWDGLPEQALEVVNRVAAGLGGKKKSALNFTLPEALLLLESTASRYRDHLRNKMPFADQISLATLYWLWRQRDRANLLWQIAHGSSRLARFAINPAAGVLRELEQLMSGGHTDYVTDNMMGVMQAVLLEEVAFAAIELYSGRLRFSDQELMHMRLSTTAEDQARLALPDEPLRILFIGQTSAGKSSLINTLLAAEHAETDAAATTPDLITYRAELDGTACHLLDSEGLDGSARGNERMLGEMTQSDVIVWVVRANRPARNLDATLKLQLDDWFEAHPRRRRPVILVVVSAIDQVLRESVSAQNPPSAAAQGIIAAAVNAIAKDLPGVQVLPVAMGASQWNLDAVADALRQALDEAKRVQRNRRRVMGAAQERRLRHQLKKLARLGKGKTP